MSQIEKKKNDSKPERARIRCKEIEVEITPVHWNFVTTAVHGYNRNPGRVTPKIRTDHLINDALDLFLRTYER